ncbi:carboxylesterase [Rhyzopertha dominica]|nr:carboxylesterase [Rhyzopertha dominica]
MRTTVPLLLICVCCALCDEGPLVKIRDGWLRGKTGKSKGGRTFFSFTSIPYAKPPVGELRFQPPVPNDPWEDIRNATEIHSDCPQRNPFTGEHVKPAVGNEDCLYLNVYTPKIPKQDKTLLPVMIFLHGGGWVCGGGNTNWYAPDTLLDRDVVLVSPNYRLGPLGFLTTGDEIVPGNNGLKDQVLVLKWIKQNIAQFGGDPDSVTVFGESAGGASTHYLMLSPMSKGLFHRGISHSGTALCPWAFGKQETGVSNSRKLAEFFKCPTKNSKEMVQCLRKVDAKEIIEQDIQFMVRYITNLIQYK